MIATHHVLFCFLPVLLLLTSYATATRSPLRTRSRSVSNQADPITKEVLRWMNAFLQQGDYPGGGNFNGVDDLVEDLVKRRMKNNVKTRLAVEILYRLPNRCCYSALQLYGCIAVLPLAVYYNCTNGVLLYCHLQCTTTVVMAHRCTATNSVLQL
eukprot:Lankesteria_metandrocarpae@DN3714_c0_g1_i2.p1